jgi:hypothetical protein
MSCNVVFDESMFPFALVNPNAAAHYTTNILLLPDSPSRVNSDLPVDNVQTNMCL